MNESSSHYFWYVVLWFVCVHKWISGNAFVIRKKKSFFLCNFVFVFVSECFSFHKLMFDSFYFVSVPSLRKYAWCWHQFFDRIKKITIFLKSYSNNIFFMNSSVVRVLVRVLTIYQMHALMYTNLGKCFMAGKLICFLEWTVRRCSTSH